MNDFFLADDLSGALDAAAAFRAAGARVRIVWSREAWDASAPDDITGFTTETRNASPVDASAAVARAIAHGRARGGRLVYKKIDSTLRGPVAAELAAVASALPATRVLFCPANPAAGRTVRDGVLLVRGVPVAETEFGRDPVSPVRASEIRRLLGAAASERVTIADAGSDADLMAAVARMTSAGDDWIAVGSGALARGGGGGGGGAGGGGWRAGEKLARGRWLFVCGSAHGVNREQARLFAHERGVARHELAAGNPQPAVRATAEALRTRGAAAMALEPARVESGAALRAISAAAAELIAGADVRRVFVTGGETMFALCEALGVTSLEFRAEVEPGLSISHGETRIGSVLFAVKPGGFGDARTWLRAWDALAGA